MFLASSLLISSAAMCQSAVLTSGGTATNGKSSVSYSIGQTMADYTTGTNGGVTTGVQQIFTIVKVKPSQEDNIAELQAEVNVYPNPTVDQLNLIANSEEELSYVLTSMNSQKMLQGRFVGSEILNMDNMSANTYMLQVSNKSGQVKTFKIIKH